MKLMIIVGARPNFMKAAPLVHAIRSHNRPAESLSAAEPVNLVLVHTGQHYDEAMSGSFFADLQMPDPHVHLGVGSGSHAVQTAEIMRRFEEVVLRERPDVVLVVGDVNSTVACALVAAKVAYDSDGSRPLIAHVEAGLRSYDRAMPEEINRIVTDHLSDLLFVTEESAIRNLAAEGIGEGKIHFVGNTMIDSLLGSVEKADRSPVLNELGLRAGLDNGSGCPHRYALLTLHRPSNVDKADTFRGILDGLAELAASFPIFFSAHPRTRKRIAEFGLGSFFLSNGTQRSRTDASTTAPRNGIHILDPLGYIDFLSLMMHASLVVTDSGGIQEETTCLGVPCVTVRENTERPVTVSYGSNILAGTRSASIRDAVCRQLSHPRTAAVPEKWDGMAARRIIEAITLHATDRVAESLQADV